MNRVRMIACIVAGAVTVSGCQSPTVVAARPKIVLRALPPICVSKDDRLTEGTAKQIERNNLAQASLGGPDKCISEN